MPASYEVRLQSGATARTPSTPSSPRCGSRPASADVRYDRQWLDRLLSARDLFAGSACRSAVVLALAAALTVANVVRLALHARRDEIEIMQLVGAPQVYVRGPFVMEGVFQGGIGAVVALAGAGRGVCRVAGELSDAAGRGDQPVVRALPVVRLPAWSCWRAGWSSAAWAGLLATRLPNLNLVTES